MKNTTTTAPTLKIQARKVNVSELHETLKRQRERMLDVVVPATNLLSVDGDLVITSPEGVEHRLETMNNAVNQLCAKLGIPRRYYDAMKDAGRLDMIDDNINGWLKKSPKSHLIRAFTANGDEGRDGRGWARAFLSDRYRSIDNLPILATAIDVALKQSAGIQVENADITETKMFVRFTSPEISRNVVDLVGNMRSGDRSGRDYPHVFAGIEIKNSEVGLGQFTTTPRLVLQVCINGQLRTIDAAAQTHLGGQLQGGTVHWSDETVQRNMRLIESQMRDTLSVQLSGDYLDRWANEQRVINGTIIEQPTKLLQKVSKKVGYSEEEQDAIISQFAAGGDASLFGLTQAVTAHAQTVEDGGRQSELEASVDDLIKQTQPVLVR